MISEPFGGNCSADSGCMWLADYEIGIPDGPIIEDLVADPSTRIGDAYTMTYSTEGVLTFGDYVRPSLRTGIIHDSLPSNRQLPLSPLLESGRPSGS